MIRTINAACNNIGISRTLTTHQQEIQNIVSLLEECGNSKLLATGKIAHSVMIRKGMLILDDTFIHSRLAIMYAKCLAPDEGCRVFAKMSITDADVAACNCLLSVYSRLRRLEDAVRIFHEMGPHLQNTISWNILIAAFVGSGRMKDAQLWFDRMPQRDAVSWSSLIAGYNQTQNSEEALKVFSKMRQHGFRPNACCLSSILGVCGSSERMFFQGRVIHGCVTKSGFGSNMFVGSALVSLYGKFGSLDDLRRIFDASQETNVASCNAAISGYAAMGRIDDARLVFQRLQHRNVVSWTAMLSGYIENSRMNDALEFFARMPERNVVSWTAIISGFVLQGRGDLALDLFRQMQSSGIRPNETTFSSIISACADLGFLEGACQIQACIIKMGFESDAFIQSSMIDVYSKCATAEDLDACYHKFSCMDTVSRNVLIAGYARNGRLGDARLLFDEMPDADVVSWNSMVAAYCQNGELENGYKLFLKLPAPTAESWTTIILGLAQNGKIDEASELFIRMPKRDIIAWTAMISCYICNSQIEDARRLFDEMPERNIVSWDVMIAGYAQQGMMDEACRLFDSMPEQTAFSWSAIISGHVQIGECENALQLYFSKQQAGVKPNPHTVSTALHASSLLPTMGHGQKIHVHALKFGFSADVLVLNSLITMYTKCGCIDTGRLIFDYMPERDSASWNAMILGYALHGLGREGTTLFDKMLDTGITPDGTCFLTVLLACSHAGLRDAGWRYFNLMKDVYCVTPQSVHYACMVDLCGRAGLLCEAKEVINQMPIEPDEVVWAALLGACEIHGNVGLGKYAAAQIAELKQETASMYISLSSMYAKSGSWDSARNLCVRRNDTGLRLE